MLQLKVKRKAVEAEGIYSFELVDIKGAELPPFSAGAHIDLHITHGLTRQYSLCNDPKERHRYLISVLKDPASRGGSVALHEQVQEGQVIRTSAPRNVFPLAPSASRHLLFAGGIGITPMLAMAHTLFAQGAAFELHYCFRSRERAAFIDALGQAPFAAHLHLHDGSGTSGHTLNAQQLLTPATPGSHLYVCGPAGFMGHILETARQSGWPENSLHRELFTAAPTDQSANKPFEVELASTGQVLQIPADRSVFEVLDAAGISLETSCEQGVCGTCVTRVLAGVPEHRDQFLSAAEQAANDRFTPCCSRARTARLVLDL